MITPKRFAMILVAVLNILYAWMFIVGKFALFTGKPIFMTAVRMMIAGIISSAIYAYHNLFFQTIRKLSMTQWSLIGLLSLTNIYFCNAFELWGLQYLSAGKTAFIYNLGPFFAALLAYFLFSERMTIKKWIGLILGFIGFLPIFLEPSSVIDTSGTLGWLSYAQIALLIASFATVVGWTTMSYMMKKYQLSLFFLNGTSMLFGGLLCFVHAYFFEQRPYIAPGCIEKFIWYAFFMACSQNIVAYNLHAYLLQYYTTTFLTFACFLSSLFAAALGVLLLHEIITLYFFVAIILVLGGLIIFYYEELRQGYIKK
jgi:drug/metabolite transporter (DMT)-like permease